jgi:hypothetical protein
MSEGGMRWKKLITDLIDVSQYEVTKGDLWLILTLLSPESRWT